MSNHDREGSYPSNRDAPLERAWREVSDEQPPAHLDAAIVAAARHAVGVRGEQPTPAPAREATRTWLTRWQPLAAAASIAGLAFVLVQMLPREHSRAPLPQRQESAPAATASPPPPPPNSPALETTDNTPAPGVTQSIGAPERDDVAAAAPRQDAVPAPPTLPEPRASAAEATAGDSAEVRVESSVDRREAVAPETTEPVAPAASAAPSAKAAARERNLGQTAPPLDPAAWVARIATLHAAGDVTAAEQVLRDFRASEPQADSYLPESLRSWAQTVH